MKIRISDFGFRIFHPPSAEGRQSTGISKFESRNSKSGEAGFTLAIFIMVIAVMAIMMAAAVEIVSFQARREKEAELIFRGQQYVEGIRLYRQKYGRYPMRMKELWEADPKVLPSPDPTPGAWSSRDKRVGSSRCPEGVALDPLPPGPRYSSAREKMRAKRSGRSSVSIPCRPRPASKSTRAGPNTTCGSSC
jgi:type II secretory pathway pseudopilin PulG